MLYARLDEIAADVIDYYDSNIGEIDVDSVNSLFDTLLNIIQTEINNKLAGGISLERFLEGLIGFDFVDFTESTLINEKKYIQLQATPIFKVSDEDINDFIEQNFPEGEDLSEFLENELEKALLEEFSRIKDQIKVDF